MRPALPVLEGFQPCQNLRRWIIRRLSNFSGKERFPKWIQVKLLNLPGQQVFSGISKPTRTHKRRTGKDEIEPFVDSQGFYPRLRLR